MRRLRADELPALTTALRGLNAEASYRALANRWAVSDALMDAYQHWDAAEASLLDWSRLENR